MQTNIRVKRITEVGIIDAEHEPKIDHFLFTTSHLMVNPEHINLTEDGPIYSYESATGPEPNYLLGSVDNTFSGQTGWKQDLVDKSDRSLSLMLSSLYVLRKRLAPVEINKFVASCLNAKLNPPACGLLLRLLYGESLISPERRFLGWSIEKLCKSLGTALDQTNLVLAAIMRSNPTSQVEVEEQHLLCSRSGESLSDPVLVDGALCNRSKTSESDKGKIIETPKIARLCKCIQMLPAIKLPTSTRFWKLNQIDSGISSSPIDLMGTSKTLRTSCPMMYPLPPLSLKLAPTFSLTVNEAKQYCCFVGRGKDVSRSAILLCLLDEKETEVDPQDLAKKLSVDEIYSDFSEGDRPTEEAVIVCFDKSLSMDEDAFEIQSEPLPLIDMTSDQISQKILTHKIFPFADAVIRGPNVTALKVLKELVHLVTPLAKDPNLKEILQMVRASLSMDDSPNDVRVVMCPITNEPVVDPVITCDGYTYERSAIEKWLLTSDVSPLTGLKLQSKILIPNIAIRGGSQSHAQTLKVKISSPDDVYEIEMSATPNLRASDVISLVKDLHPNSEYKWTAFCGTTMLREEGKVIGLPKVLVRGRELVNVQIEAGSFDSYQTLVIENGCTTLEILWNLYENSDFRSHKPSKTELWRDLKPTQDNYRNGELLTLDQHIFIFNKATTFHAFSTDRRGTMGKKPEVLSKLTLSKQLFHCFTDRTDAYNYMHKVGLIEFASEVNVVCRPTSTLDLFHDSLENISASGNTLMYDSIIEASKCLSALNLPESAKLRILLLTDGKDSGSTTTIGKAIEEIRSNKIVLDAICMKVENIHLRKLSAMTGGLCFCPKSLEDAMDVIQLETLLRLSVREHSFPVQNEISSYRATNAKFDTASGSNRPRLKDESVKTRFYSGTNKITSTSNANSRIVKELMQIIEEKHPAYEVFFSENLRSWKVLMSGPAEDEAEDSPYSGGSFILSVSFGDNYPNSPPEVRFITPILHCNVNSYGRICHSVLDRNWTLETSMSTVLQCIYGLLLTPEPDDPLDVYLAQMYHTNRQEYSDKIREHVNKFGTATAAEIIQTNKMAKFSSTTNRK
eukprot:TRINITY_DN2661_c0_g2_i1.p1 TRINITY_DN2661_c0_g2~~TRINITY_DN2661_c0_g2_i1.p1  ORF type:complete len:1075 (+),score=177.70 TRINITY_DN2661_c0_g2_i1:81-3305(+)